MLFWSWGAPRHTQTCPRHTQTRPPNTSKHAPVNTQTRPSHTQTRPRHTQTRPRRTLASFTYKTARGGTIRACWVPGRPQTHPNAPQPNPNTPQTHPNTRQTHPGKFHMPDCMRMHDSCFFGPGVPPDTQTPPAIPKHAPDTPRPRRTQTRSDTPKHFWFRWPDKFHVPDCTRRHDSCFFGPGAPLDTPKRAPDTPKHAPCAPKHAQTHPNTSG